MSLRNIPFILLIVLMVSSAILPLINTVPSTNSFHPGVRRGGGAVILAPQRNYDPVASAQVLMARSDRNNNYIEDKLEENISGRPGNESIRIIIWWAAKPVIFGADKEALMKGLDEAMDIVRSVGGKIIRGPWIHALVGFSAIVKVKDIQLLASRLSKIDLDGDGVLERLEINLDKKVRTLNYWSSRQMGIRPWVWRDLEVNGSDTTVVVIDTGIDGDNSAFPPGKIIYWEDYINNQPEPYDDHFHGTHVAGTVAGYYSAFDDQGRLVFNFGYGYLNMLGGTSGAWYWFSSYVAYYVNSTGTIELDAQWKGLYGGTVSSIGIVYCGSTTLKYCSGSLVAYTSTPSSNTWYTVTYNVDSPSKYGWYAFVYQLGSPGYIAILPVMHVPVSKEYVDLAPYLSGMAPAAKLGGAKVMSSSGSGSTTDIISAIDDVVANRMNYDPPLYIISMSIGGAYDSSLETAVSNAVNSGVVVVVAAGNDGTGDNYAGNGSPSANPYAVTVAAVDAFFNITSYSSQGGSSQTDPSVIKPDLAAPGGGEDMVIFSADSTSNDDTGTYDGFDWSDAVNTETAGYDDSLGITGTSMATPHVSGAAALVVDALINHAGLSWDWSSSSTALLVKNILLMSSVETYPLEREDAPSYSPTLDRGGKDVHEGYGALDAYAAVEIALSYGAGKALLPGSTYNDSFRDGVLYNADFGSGVWRFPFGHSAWGSRVVFPVTEFTLANGSVYYPTYGLALYPNTSSPYIDLDLYLYSITGDNYGEPIILDSSTQGFGYSESLTINPHSLGVEQAVVVVKRAREDSIGGPWIFSYGPWMNLTGTAPDYSKHGDQVWIGWPIDIEVMSALKASKAIIEFYDNTTGSTINKTIINLDDGGSYSYGSLQYLLPFDKGLVGHQLVVIVTFQDSSGNTVSGPIYSSATINDAPQPIPEPTGILAAIIILAIIAVLLVTRRIRI